MAWRALVGDVLSTPRLSAPFVNFSDELMGCDEEAEEVLVAYALRCLDALSFRWGPAHIEVKLTSVSGAPVSGSARGIAL